jgi:phosphate-selective porin
VSCASTSTAQSTPEFELSPRGYIQFDWREYPDWTVPLGGDRLNRQHLEIRRARVGVDGRWKQVAFEVTVDPQDTDGVLVKDAYGQMRFSRALRLRVGQFKVPGGREYQTSARSIDFMERSALSESLAAGRDIGAMLTGEIGSRLEYQAGVFAGDGNGRGDRAGVTAAGRAEWQLAGDLDVGTSFSMSRTEADDTQAPDGLIGRASSGYRFFDGLYVDGWRLRSGADAAWTPGPWRVRGEFLRTDESRHAQGLDFEDLPTAVGTGVTAEVTRQFLRRGGNNRNRWREFDVSLRVDWLGFDENGPETDRDSVRARATDVRPRSVLAGTAGVSWSPTNWTRVLTNVSREKYSDPRTGPEPGRAGFWVFGTRLQLELP